MGKMVFLKMKIKDTEDYLQVLRFDEGLVTLMTKEGDIIKSFLHNEKYKTEEDKEFVREYIEYNNNMYYVDEFEKKYTVRSILESLLSMFKTFFFKKIDSDSKLLKTTILSMRVGIILGLVWAIPSADSFLGSFITVFSTVFVICYIPEILKIIFKKKVSDD